jgi:hypothetical protein
MPIARFQMPDGRIARFEVPEGTTPEQAQAMIAENAQKLVPKQEKSLVQEVGQGLGNLAAGAVRGAGSIGATLLAPVDIAKDALAGRGLSLESNRQRRADMDAGLQSLGAEPDSLLYKGGKLGGEIAGTLGAGGAAANVLSRVAPRAAAAAPGLVEALRTSGMTAGAGGIGTRMAGGAITGGLSAGLVNPEDAAMGAVMGGALPVVAKGAGMVGEKIGNTIRGPAQSPDMAAAIQAARSQGYVIPPTQANPTLGNRLLEGMAGKLTTAQNASAANQGVTNRLAAEALGLPGDTKLTADVLKSVRDSAGQAYQAVTNAGTITPGAKYMQALDDIAAPHVKAMQGFPNAKASPVLDLVDSLKSPSFDAGSAVAKIKELRSAADDAFRTGNTDVGRAAKKAAGALEDAIEDHLQAIGQTDALAALREARKTIAKTYTVEKALNQSSGTVDAKKLAAQLQKGKPLSGDLRSVAEFAARFPKASQAVEGMGSLPQTSPLDWFAGVGLSAATSSPLGLLSVAARPAARKAVLSPMVQNGLIQNQAPGLLSDPSLLQFGYRAAPLLMADQ